MISLISAIFFIIFGFIVMKYSPENINSVIGYKSPLAKKNQDTWDVSQKHSGFITIIFGVINGIFGIWSLIQPMAINKESVQLTIILLTAIAIVVIEEIHLMKLFNMDGSRKKEVKRTI